MKPDAVTDHTEGLLSPDEADRLVAAYRCDVIKGGLKEQQQQEVL